MHPTRRHVSVRTLVFAAIVMMLVATGTVCALRAMTNAPVRDLPRGAEDQAVIQGSRG